MSTTPEVEKLLETLDFTVTCSVGRAGGLHLMLDENEPQPEPCPNPADFVSDYHQHPADGYHYWCADHLAQTCLDLKQLFASAQCVCIVCSKPLADVPDVVFNVKPLAGKINPTPA